MWTFIFFIFLFFKVRILFLLKPRGSVSEGQGSEGGSLRFELNLTLLSLTFHPHLFFASSPQASPLSHQRQQDLGMESLSEDRPYSFQRVITVPSF